MPKFRITWFVGVLAVTTVTIGTMALQPATNSRSDATLQPSVDTLVDSADLSSTTDHFPVAPVERNGLIELPNDLASVDWKSCKGSLVRIRGSLVVVDTYNLATYGQVTLATERLYVPTNSIDPNDADPDGNLSFGNANVSQVLAAQQSNDRRCIFLEDGLVTRNHYPFELFPGMGREYETIRLGTKILDLTGVVVENEGKFFIEPQGEIAMEHALRPARPDLGKANLTIASFNVLNYFTTIDDGFGEARGADSLSELARQRAKIIAAIVELEADVIGLMELENQLQSEFDLVTAINQTMGSEVYVGCGIPSAFRETPGGDGPIRVGLIYRKDRVEAIGATDMIADDAFFNARAPLQQEFRVLGGSDPFTVIVNHFKSKSPQGASGDDFDRQDGQGAFNGSRKRQAAAIVRHVESLRKSHASRVLIIGDLNAYGQEDPIDLLRESGLIDLAAVHSETQHYSYVYYGQAGCLDHAFASSEFANQVTHVAAWHINADEPRCLDYNEEQNPNALYRPTPYRSSDHDPILIGIELQ